MTEIQPGDVIYYPTVDPNVGFAIEEITVKKLVGPSNNIQGKAKLLWSYGNIELLKSQQERWTGKPRLFVKKNCYRTVEDCLVFLEEWRQKFITSQESRREEILSEVVEFRQFLKELEAESLDVSRSTRKTVAMLHKFDIRRDLEKRGLINHD